MAGETLESGEVVMLSDEEALEALQAGDSSVLDTWYQQRFTAADKTLEGRIALDAQKANIQHAAGDDAGAIETLMDTRSLAHAAGAADEQIMLEKLIIQYGGNPKPL